MNEEQILIQTRERMAAAIEGVRKKLSTIRTGRASINVLDRISVDYYGTPTPLNQMAKLSVPEPTLILAQPFDPAVLADVERAIMASDLGVNPSNDGKVIRIPIPPLTEERRKQMVKKVGGFGEEAKTAVRQVRRESNDEIRKLEKEKTLSKDEAHRAHDEIQKVTDKHTGEIDAICSSKEQELMEI